MHDASLQGRWTPTEAVLGGNVFPDPVRTTISLTVEGDRYTVAVGGTVDRGRVVADTSVSPATLDIMGDEGPNAGRTIPAIFERDGEALRVCYDLGGAARPTTFASAPGTMHFLVTYTKG